MGRALPKFSVLIVDDDCTLCRAMEDFLAQSGYDVECVQTGRGALRRLESGALPDVILLDIQLPDIDGVAVLARLRVDERLSRVPVVAISAGPYRAGLEDAVGFLAKPCAPEVLLQRVRMWCEAV